MLRTITEAKKFNFEPPEPVLVASTLTELHNYLLTLSPDEDPKHSVVEFTIQQLLILSRHLDYSDEAGRRAIEEVTDSMLTTLALVKEEGISAILVILRILHPGDFFKVLNEYVQAYREVFSASGIDESLKQRSWLRAIACIKSCLVTIDRELSNELLLMYDQVIIPAFYSEMMLVVEAGLHCMILYGTAEKSLLPSILPTLCQLAHSDYTELAVLALGGLFDAHMLYGGDQVDRTSMALMQSSLYSADMDVCARAVEGWCKLLLHRISNSVDVLEGLLVLFGSPVTSEALRLRQCLAYFFPVYAFSSLENQAIMAELIPKILLQSISYPNLAQLANQLLHYCDPSQLVNNLSGPSHYASIAVRLCWLCLKDPDTNLPLLALMPKIPISAADPFDLLKEFLFLLGAIQKCGLGPGGASLKTLMRKVSELTGFEGLEPSTQEKLKQRLLKTFPSKYHPLYLQSKPIANKKKVPGAGRDANFDFDDDLLQDVEEWSNED